MGARFGGELRATTSQHGGPWAYADKTLYPELFNPNGSFLTPGLASWFVKAIDRQSLRSETAFRRCRTRGTRISFTSPTAGRACTRKVRWGCGGRTLAQRERC